MNNNPKLGPGAKKLEELNQDTFENSDEYTTASFIYENILSHAQDYIKANAPVTELILSRNADKDGKDMYNPNEPNILFLSGRSVRRAPYLGHSDYISSHPISEMLRYILKTEGWIQYSDHEYHLFLPRKGVICDI